jgi:uncharacterized membrane protein
MPYRWIEQDDATSPAELHLWPHRSLTGRGFVWFFGSTFALVSLPLLAVIGSPILWGLLPFFVICLGGMWLAIRRNDRDRSVFERLRIDSHELSVERHDPGRAIRRWSTNPYWVRVLTYPKDGPVEHYLTLKGDGREIEIGSFLSPEERQDLEGELRRALDRVR